MKAFIFVLALIIPVTGFCLEKADLVLVVKSESKLYLLKDGKVDEGTPIEIRP
jgi:hypothetical protein